MTRQTSLALLMASILLLPISTHAATSSSSVEAELRAQIKLLLERIAQLEGKSILTEDASTVQIEDVVARVDGSSARVSWTTSLPSESRLILDNGEGKVFESKSTGTKHQVKIGDLEASREYEFKITARTHDKLGYDDLYDSFSADKEYTASLGSVKGKCQIILVTDTAGKPAKKLPVTISGYLETENSRIARPNVKETTNSKGEVKYCKPMSVYNLKGKNLDVKLDTKKAIKGEVKGG